MCKYCKGEIEEEFVEYTTKAERRKHHGDCCGTRKRIVVSKFPNTDLGVHIKGNTLCVPSYTEYDGQTIYVGEEFMINYCPFCGKKLS